SEFSSDIEQDQENYSDVNVNKTHDIYNANKIYSDNNSIQDIDDNSTQEIYNDLLSLYYDDFEIGEYSKNTVPEIIKIIDSDDNSSENRYYTLQKKSGELNLKKLRLFKLLY
ncbi:24669_t:CDS:2, partial [Cetraspora pellucida]